MEANRIEVLAAAIKALTYDEMMEVAEWVANSVNSTEQVIDREPIDRDSVAAILSEFADENIDG